MQVRSSTGLQKHFAYAHNICYVQRISITLQLRVVINRDVQESLAYAITKAHDSSAALGGYEGIQQINA